MTERHTLSTQLSMPCIAPMCQITQPVVWDAPMSLLSTHTASVAMPHLPTTPALLQICTG